MRHHPHSERGQSLVEFALIIPIVLLIIVGVFDLGRVVFVNNSLSDGARDGARHASTDPRAAGYCARVTDAVRSAVRGQALDTFTVTLDTLDGDGNVLDSYVICQNGANGPDMAAMIDDEQVSAGDRVTVDLETNVDLVIGFIARAAGQSTFNLHAASTMQVTFAPAS